MVLLGRNIKLGEDGKYNLYVCGWLESSPKGHNEWSNSIVFHAVSNYSYGPFVVKDTIGKGLEYKIVVLINPLEKQPSMLHGKVTPLK